MMCYIFLNNTTSILHYLTFIYLFFFQFIIYHLIQFCFFYLLNGVYHWTLCTLNMSRFSFLILNLFFAFSIVFMRVCSADIFATCFTGEKRRRPKTLHCNSLVDFHRTFAAVMRLNITVTRWRLRLWFGFLLDAWLIEVCSFIKSQAVNGWATNGSNRVVHQTVVAALASYFTASTHRLFCWSTNCADFSPAFRQL